MSRAFDALAAGYDRDFTASPVGRAQRAATWRRLRRLLVPGARVLELGCGTGEDAVLMARRGASVLATDPSPAMLEAARRKAEDAGVGARIALRRLSAESLEAVRDPAGFDGAWSNFGALNLVADLGPLARELGRLVRPGGWAMLVLLGRWVPWEWSWFLVRGQPGTAFRRLRRGGVAWHGETVRYPAVRTVRRAFAGVWRLRRTVGIGVLVPPSYAGPWIARHPRLLAACAGGERALAGWAPWNRFGDHVLLIFERR